jgi:hypothetical protein
MLVQIGRKIQQLESAQKLMSWCWLSEINKVRFVSCESFLPQIPERTKFAAYISSKVKSLRLSDSILSTQILLRAIDIPMSSKRRAKNHASSTAMGKPLPLTKYSTFARQSGKFLLAMRVESMTFSLQELPWSFIANGVVSRLGHLTDLLREVMFGEHMMDWW